MTYRELPWREKSKGQKQRDWLKLLQAEKPLSYSLNWNQILSISYQVRNQVTNHQRPDNMEWKQDLLQKAILREVEEEEGEEAKAEVEAGGRGRFSKLPSATDLARRILEAEQVMEKIAL